MRYSKFQLKPMIMLLPLGFIFNNGGENTNVGKMKILYQPLKKLFEYLFLPNLKLSLKISRYDPINC